MDWSFAINDQSIRIGMIMAVFLLSVLVLSFIVGSVGALMYLEPTSGRQSVIGTRLVGLAAFGLGLTILLTVGEAIWVMATAAPP